MQSFISLGHSTTHSTMTLTRSPLSRHYVLVLALIGFSLVTAALFLGTTHRDNISKLVPSVSWAGPPEPKCAGWPVVRELEAKWGRNALRMSLAHGGSGARLQRVLRRFKKEKKIVIGIVGGSITFGHGMEDGDKNWPTLLDEALKSVYPDSEVQVHNGAVGATGTDYFSACYEHHVPADSDLFIIETAVNDLEVETLGGDEDHRPDMVDYTERLVREMSSSPRNPALIMLSAFVVPHHFTNGADRHAIVSEYYDIPRVSMRSFLYPYLSQHRDELQTFFGNDNMAHPVQTGHQYMADIILYHILTQDCESEELTNIEPYPELGGSGVNGSFDPFTLPPLRVKQHLNDDPYTNAQPFCRSANVRIEGKAQLQPSNVSGWEETEWNDKHYWTSYTPGSRITFSDIDVHGGDLSLYYLRSDSWGLGNMRCWANEDEDNAVKLQGYWPYDTVTVGSTGFVAKDLAPGNHSVTCVVLDEKEDHAGVEGTYRVDIIAVLAS